MSAFAYMVGLLLAASTQPLFHIERSKNANIVKYDLRLNSKGTPAEDPIKAYWVLLAEDGRAKKLGWLERKLAYGFEVLGPVGPKGFKLRLTAWDQREIEVSPSKDGYRAVATIAGGRAVLKKIYVASDESGLMPKVLYLDLIGIRLEDGAPVHERVKPD